MFRKKDKEKKLTPSAQIIAPILIALTFFIVFDFWLFNDYRTKLGAMQSDHLFETEEDLFEKDTFEIDGDFLLS